MRWLDPGTLLALAGSAALWGVVLLTEPPAPRDGVDRVEQRPQQPDDSAPRTLARAGAVPPASSPVPAARPDHKQLRDAANGGMTPQGIAALLATVDDAELAAALAGGTHMDRRWLQEHGIGPAAQRRLAALWASTAASPLPASLEGTLVFRGPDAPAGGHAAPSAQDRQIHAEFVLPAGYQADAVIVRWVDLDNRSVVSLDRHLIGAGPSQDIWMRASGDWTPGHYRVEVFAADPGLQPLAGASLHLQHKDAP
jgi:hypothetical protein